MDVLELEDSEDNKNFEIDQAVVAKVTDVNHEKRQIELSLNLRDVYSGEVMSSVNCLESYLTGLDQILKYYSTLTGRLINKIVFIHTFCLMTASNPCHPASSAFKFTPQNFISDETKKF